MARLVYVVDVESDDPEGDELYLKKVQETFRLITVDLVNWGFAGESMSVSEVSEDRKMTDAIQRYIVEPPLQR